VRKERVMIQKPNGGQGKRNINEKVRRGVLPCVSLRGIGGSKLSRKWCHAISMPMESKIGDEEKKRTIAGGEKSYAGQMSELEKLEIFEKLFSFQVQLL
jgi:hypothetical protein